MSYEIQVIKHGKTSDKNQVVYFQILHRLDVEKLVHTINSAYWVDVEPDEEANSGDNALMADSAVRGGSNG